VAGGRGDQWFALLAIAALAAQAVPGPAGPAAVRWVGVAFSVALALVGAQFARAPAVSLACLAACIAVTQTFGVPWQVALAAALGAFVLLGRRFSCVRPSPGWRARGRVPLGWTLVAGGVTPFALAGWFLLARPDLSDVLDTYVPDVPLPVLLIGGVGFALVNAALEELSWRGVMQDRLIPLFGISGAILLQAASFGVQHAWGFPRGIEGVALAGGWAVLLGFLRQRSEGLLAPFVAHVVADATIAVIVLGLVR
jgi:membrane protease YdiL (CAAX protease family)